MRPCTLAPVLRARCARRRHRAFLEMDRARCPPRLAAFAREARQRFAGRSGSRRKAAFHSCARAAPRSPASASRKELQQRRLRIDRPRMRRTDAARHRRCRSITSRIPERPSPMEWWKTMAKAQRPAGARTSARAGAARRPGRRAASGASASASRQSPPTVSRESRSRSCGRGTKARRPRHPPRSPRRARDVCACARASAASRSSSLQRAGPFRHHGEIHRRAAVEKPEEGFRAVERTGERSGHEGAVRAASRRHLAPCPPRHLTNV